MLSRLGCFFTAVAAWLVLSASPAFAQATATYTYDALGRVITATTSAGTTTYTYDNADNRTHVTCAGSCNSSLVANPDTATVTLGGTVVVSVLANDSTPGGATLTVTSVTSAAKGAASVTAGGGSVTYVANGGQTGGDTFNYTISDGHGHTATAAVTITITAGAPVANPVSMTVAFNSANNSVPLSITGITTSVAVASSPGKGVATASGMGITYTPNNGASGSDSFTYSATGPGGTSGAATVSITVGAPAPPVANAVSASVGFNSSNNSIAASLSGNPATSVTIVSGPGRGSAQVNGLGFLYTPNNNVSGSDSFTYRATGAGGTGNTATVGLTIAAPAPPTAGNLSYAAVFNSTGNFITPNLGGGPVSSLAVISGPSHGTAVPAPGLGLAYTPANGYSGPDSFTYNASGPGGTSGTATVSITVGAPAPPTVNPVSLTVAFNSSNNSLPLSINGVANSVGVVANPAHGSVSISGLTMTYTPATGYSGSDNFFYFAQGAGGIGGSAQVSITVSPGPPSLTVNLNRTSYLGSRDPDGEHPGTIVTATPTGGSGSYSYVWQRVSGDSTVEISSPTAPSVTWARGDVLTDGIFTAVWHCVVTDTVTGATATSANVSVEYDEGTFR